MNILNKPSATKIQCVNWISKVKTAHPIAVALTPIMYDLSKKVGIDPCIVIAQAMVETGYFQFKGVLKPNFCNTCGLKGASGGSDTSPNAHFRFDYWEDGIQAHIDHLALYCGAPNYPKYAPNSKNKNSNFKGYGTTLDPRHFAYLYGKCKTVESLVGNWCSNTNYSNMIIRMVNEMRRS